MLIVHLLLCLFYFTVLKPNKSLSVAVDIGGGIGVAVAPEFGSHGSLAERGEGVELVAPRVPKLGEAMEEENDWTFSFLREVNVDAVCPYSSVLYSISLHCFVSPNSRLQIPNLNFKCCAGV